ncbi:MAG TPA: hypothetical protein VG165_09815, partial [Solirubrobacteraceae bacterium]|nr:hypothetical protein [Solirubrobacteraceae bacterium]
MSLVTLALVTATATATATAVPATAAAAPTTAAAAPWSTPAGIPGAPDSSPLLAQDAAGPQAVYWETLDLSGPSPSTDINTFVSPLGPGLQPGAAAVLSPPLNTGSAVAYGHGQVALAQESGIATGPVTGPFVVHPLPIPVRAIAADASGEIAGVMEQCDPSGCDPAAPELAIARPGHPFGRPIRLDRKGSDNGVGLAMDQHGRILVAWDRDGGVYARFVSARGKPGPLLHLGSEPAPSGFDVVISGDGRAAVGWTSQAVDEGDAGSPFTATLALAGTNGRFGRARRLATVPVTGEERFVPYGGLVVALPAGRVGLAAWTGYDGTDFIVQAASIGARGVGTPRTVSPPGTNAVLADAAEGPQGQAVILILPGLAGALGAGPSATDGLAAVTHTSATRAFGPPETIVPGPAAVDGASVGIDASTG